MTEKKLEELVRVWQRRLGLDRHDISIEWDVSEEGQEEGVLAQCAQFVDYDKATLRFNARLFPKWTPPEAHRIVAHELLHVIMRDVENMLFKQLDGQLQRDVLNVIERAHTHYIEQAVDRLAYRFVELAGVDG